MRKRLNLIIKSAIAIAFVVGVGYQLLHERDLGLIWQNFMSHWTLKNAWLIIIAIALMPVCWLLESAKWKLLMRFCLSALPGGVRVPIAVQGIMS